ncbi:MAG: DUF4282 domain-containing protein [Candidatus Margulisbacteria bacterium]|nr:DUF4282 domain-containing protein [Candidatus Margulisiibacteriota bacterium]
MKDLLAFKIMITPVVIQIAFWIGVASCVLGGLITMFSGNGAGGALMGLAIIILGPIAVRVYAELLIIIFKIYEAVKK